MSTSTTTYLRFAINEDVLSLRDLVTCLRIDKKDIHGMRLVDIGEDDWNTYEFDINGVLTAKDLDDEFGGTYVIKNVYLNGIALEEYEYDDTESTQETVDSDLLNDTEVEEDDESEIHPESASQTDEDDEVSVVEKDEEDDSGAYVDVDEEEEEEESDSDSDSESSESTSSGDSSDNSEESKESMEKTAEEMLASLQKKFPDISTEPPSEEQKAVLEKIASLFREEKIAIGNYKTGSIKACTGYSPMKDGGILLYF